MAGSFACVDSFAGQLSRVGSFTWIIHPTHLVVCPSSLVWTASLLGAVLRLERPYSMWWAAPRCSSSAVLDSFAWVDSLTVQLSRVGSFAWIIHPDTFCWVDSIARVDSLAFSERLYDSSPMGFAQFS